MNQRSDWRIDLWRPGFMGALSRVAEYFPNFMDAKIVSLVMYGEFSEFIDYYAVIDSIDGKFDVYVKMLRYSDNTQFLRNLSINRRIDTMGQPV